jgi:hyperosmotically inducible periplasmic protein
MQKSAKQGGAGEKWETAVAARAHCPTRANRGLEQADSTEDFMKKLILSAVVAVSSLGLASVTLADQPADSDSSHAGAYVKDSVITTKVKAKLAAKHMSTLTKIKVDTDAEGVVWLSGKAPTQDASDLAAMVAKDTDGVRSVHNKIVIAQ